MLLLLSLLFVSVCLLPSSLMDEGEDDEFWCCGKNQLSALL